MNSSSGYYGFEYVSIGRFSSRKLLSRDVEAISDRGHLIIV